MRKCPECKKKYSPKYSSLQPTCNEFSCMAKHAKKSGDKKRKAKKEENKAFIQKVKIEDLGYQHGLTQSAFNKMRVLEEKLWFQERGIEPYCISCQKTDMDWCNGHFKTRGSQGNLRYCKDNSFLQCNWACNRNLSGNIEGNKKSIGYKQGLIFRFGEEEGNRIITFCETNTAPVKWYWEDLKNFRAECNANIRRLKQQLSQMPSMSQVSRQ